jgi:hypothetical protein
VNSYRHVAAQVNRSISQFVTHYITAIYEHYHWSQHSQADKLSLLLLLQLRAVAAVVAHLLRRELYDAAAIGDVDRVLCAMAHGADLSWSNEAEGSNTAAHQVTLTAMH